MTMTSTEYDSDDFQTLASTNDMYDRLATTLAQSDMDGSVVRAIVLQLAGAPPRPTELGEDIQGDIHLAIISDTSANLSRLFSAVMDITPLQTAHLNGTSTTKSGVLGSVSGSELSPGPVLDDETELTLIEQLDATSGKVQGAFQQILDAGSYSFAKANYRETVSASGSVLIGVNPEYEHFDQYEGIANQLSLTPALLTSADLSITNVPEFVESVQTDEKPLEKDLARQYLAYARSIDPALDDDTLDEIDRYLEELEPILDDVNIDYKPGLARLRETLVRFALAHARLRLSTRTTRADATRIIALVESVLENLGVDPEPIEFDEDIVETGWSSSQ